MSNWITVGMSVLTITILFMNNEWLKPKLSKLCMVPMPIQLIAAVGGTLASKYLDLAGNYNIVTVGHIPRGIPGLYIHSMAKHVLLLILHFSRISIARLRSLEKFDRWWVHHSRSFIHNKYFDSVNLFATSELRNWFQPRTVSDGPSKHVRIVFFMSSTVSFAFKVNRSSFGGWANANHINLFMFSIVVRFTLDRSIFWSSSKSTFRH